jgi:diadenosine tetraphosphatase ApaH/serine/threonine PP2A family protein phosphatase
MDRRPFTPFFLSQKSYNPSAVRILLLSDIHSNLEALEACVAAAPAHDLVVNLGDTVGYGGNPNEVIARAQTLGRVFVRGNHDKAACGLKGIQDFNPVAGLATIWTRNQLTPENLDWLRALPRGPILLDELPGIQFVHGSAHDEDAYVVSALDAIVPLTIDVNSVPVTFFGHTHLQGGFSLAGKIGEAHYPEYRSAGELESFEWPLRKDDEKDKDKDGKDKVRRYLINPGSVGQPRDGDWRAAFAVFDPEAWMVTFYRVPYNVLLAQEKILAANLPQRLATRLATGR